MKSRSVIVETGFPVKDGGEDEGAALEHSTASLNICWRSAGLRLLICAEASCGHSPEELRAAWAAECQRSGS